MLPTKKDVLLYISLFVSGLVLLLFIFNTIFVTPDVVYVDNIQLFDGFNMTKEMKRIGENQFNTQKAKIDSLYVTIQKAILPNRKF